MANISNINNTFENLNLKNKLCKLEDSKMDQYVLRKHINYSIPNSFIPKIPKVTTDIPSISAFVPSLKQTQKSQVEELHKLQVEIASVEDKIRELEFSKNLKLTKVGNYKKYYNF
jgi:Trm5-related predicted tRNA methylase